MMKDGDMPILIAHGGGNKEFPDNTLEAFYNAYSVDPRVMMESDVSITKDGVLILSHDITLDRKTNVTGYISDWNYSDLMAQKVDFGYTNPTSSGVLDGERKHFVGEDGEIKYPTDVTYPEGVVARDEKVFLATKSLVKNAHRHNLAVHYRTINDVEEMKYLISIGADGIMTDYPHRLQEVYESYGK